MGSRQYNWDTPPHPTPAFPFNVMAFPFNGMAFPFNGPSWLLGVPMAWRRRHAMAKWRCRRRKWRGARIPGTPRAAIPLHGNAITLDFRKRRGGVGLGGVAGWGSTPSQPPTSRICFAKVAFLGNWFDQRFPKPLPRDPSRQVRMDADDAVPLRLRAEPKD
jgi:hypothetical protein